MLPRLVYYRATPNRDPLFGFFLFGHGVYLVSALMHDVETSMDFAFGLFAVLRYRTEAISLRYMTYLFTVIVLSLTSAVGPIGLGALVAIGSTLVALVALAETSLLAPRTLALDVVHDGVANVAPERLVLLEAELEARLGARVRHVEVGEVDLLRDAAGLRVTLDGPPRRTRAARSAPPAKAAPAAASVGGPCAGTRDESRVPPVRRAVPAPRASTPPPSALP